jgi:hypothetical protein
MNKELNSKYFICNFTSNYRWKQFSLGMCLASEPNHSVSEDFDYSILNTNEQIETIKRREYYASLYLGFWQFHFGFRV